MVQPRSGISNPRPSHDLKTKGRRENEVRFKLPGLEEGEGKIMVSLLIDGMETNALPFYVVKEVTQ